MEALTAASVAALTVYDMVKGVERGVEIRSVHLVSKSGGQSGEWRRPGRSPPVRLPAARPPSARDDRASASPAGSARSPRWNRYPSGSRALVLTVSDGVAASIAPG